MRTVVVRNGTRISLGKQGENKAVRVVWPEIAEKYTKLYGDGRFELVVVQKGQAYPAVVNVDGPDLIWNVLAADVATVGAGSLELIYYVGDTIAKSQTWETFVEVSKSAEGTTEPPEATKNWVDAVLKSSSDAKQSAMESAESAMQSAESSVNAANSANEAHKSREAIENMEVSAVSLPSYSDATVEKSIVDDKVKLTFGIPRGENGGGGGNDIFWLNTTSSSHIAETFDEILAAYKAGKNIWIRDTHSFKQSVATAPAFLVQPFYDDNDNNINGMIIVCGGTARGFSGIGVENVLINATYYIIYDPTDPSPGVYFSLEGHMCAELGDSNTPNESQWNGSAGDSTYASPVDHIHPAPFPDWTSSIGKALFVNNANETPSQAFEWRDVPNGDFTSKVGDFLRVAEVDSNNKPTKWTTDSGAGTKEPMVVTFTVTDMSTFALKADTPCADIVEAANAGRIVYAFVPAPIGPMFGQLSRIEDNNILFNAFSYNGQIINITMYSDFSIIGTVYNLLYRPVDAIGGGDFEAYNHRIMDVEEPIDPSDAATKRYVDKRLSSSDISLGITAATVGQTVKVKAVDTEGKPTAWEAVELTADDVGAISQDDLANVQSTIAEKMDSYAIKTVMDSVATPHTQYYLGNQTTVDIVLPDSADVGQIIMVCWYNGDTAATLSITGTMLSFDYTPSANTRSEINALWDGTYWAVLGNEMAVPSEVTA